MNESAIIILITAIVAPAVLAVLKYFIGKAEEQDKERKEQRKVQGSELEGARRESDEWRDRYWKLREEMSGCRQEIVTLKQEIVGFQQEIARLGTEVVAFKQEIAKLKQEAGRK